MVRNKKGNKPGDEEGKERKALEWIHSKGARRTVIQLYKDGFGYYERIRLDISCLARWARETVGIYWPDDIFMYFYYKDSGTFLL